MTYYTGAIPFGHLTGQQVDAIEVAARSTPDPGWHDGVWRNVRASLAGDGPWDDADINAAIKVTLADLGLANSEP